MFVLVYMIGDTLPLSIVFVITSRWRDSLIPSPLKGEVEVRVKFPLLFRSLRAERDSLMARFPPELASVA